jgi:hypothetical protein
MLSRASDGHIQVRLESLPYPTNICLRTLAYAIANNTDLKASLVVRIAVDESCAIAAVLDRWPLLDRLGFILPKAICTIGIIAPRSYETGHYLRTRKSLGRKPHAR